jgi:hypothetical protein
MPDVVYVDDRFPPVPKAVVTKVTRACKALPETAVRETNGPVLEVVVRKRRIASLFCMRTPLDTVDTMLVVRADPDEQRVLAGMGDPYFAPGNGPVRIGVRLGSWTDWDEIRELLTEGYLIVAPKKLGAVVDVPETGSPA